jgi:hypothetical protein
MEFSKVGYCVVVAQGFCWIRREIGCEIEFSKVGLYAVVVWGFTVRCEMGFLKVRSCDGVIAWDHVMVVGNRSEVAFEGGFWISCGSVGFWNLRRVEFSYMVEFSWRMFSVVLGLVVLL